jgi:hypothetical protein
MSRKFAGSPPASLIMSIVAIARPAPLMMQPMSPVQADIGKAMIAGGGFARVFLAAVAQFGHLRTAEQGIGVEGHLGIKRHKVAPRR